jgi:hypothetical protein
VGTEAGEKDLIIFKNEYYISLPILIDENGSVTKTYRVWGHHGTFFIDRRGMIVKEEFEVENWESASMRKLLEYLLAQGKSFRTFQNWTRNDLHGSIGRLFIIYLSHFSTRLSPFPTPWI